jgi:hypothetical protein
LIKITAYGDNQEPLEAATTEAFKAFQKVADATDPYESHLEDDLYALNQSGRSGPCLS